MPSSMPSLRSMTTACHTGRVSRIAFTAHIVSMDCIDATHDDQTSLGCAGVRECPLTESARALAAVLAFVAAQRPSKLLFVDQAVTSRLSSSPTDSLWPY